MEPEAPPEGARASAESAGGGVGTDSPRGRDFCRIERWRGYVSCSFVARVPDGVLCESSSFRWRRQDPPPDEGAARAAYDELVAWLTAEGWEPHQAGPVWYETIFSRPSSGPLAAPPVAPPAATDVPPPAAARRLEVVEPTPVVQPTAPESRPDEDPDEVPPEIPVPAADVGAPASPRPAPPPPAPPAVPAPSMPQPGDGAPGIAMPEPAAPEARGRGGYVRVVAGIGLVAAVAVAALVLGGSGILGARSAPHGAPAVPPAPEAVKAAKAHAAAPVVPAAPPSPPKQVRVVIAAERGDGSWLEVRRGSSTGRVLYSGILAPGSQPLRFRAPRLWARFGAAANLAIRLDGKPVVLEGTDEKTFRPPR